MKCFFWIIDAICTYSSFIFGCTPEFSANLRLNDFGKEPSIWHPPNPFPQSIHRVKNSWVYPPKIEDFCQEFMTSFLTSSVKTVFDRKDLRGVHIVIDEEIPQNREIQHEGGRIIDGFRWSSRENRSPLTSSYFRKGNRGEGEKKTFWRTGEKTPSLLNLPTNQYVTPRWRGEYYQLKTLTLLIGRAAFALGSITLFAPELCANLDTMPPKYLNPLLKSLYRFFKVNWYLFFPLPEGLPVQLVSRA